MGRAERRRLEKQKKNDNNNEKLLVTKNDISKLKQKVSQDAIDFNVEALMTCFALAEHRLYGFGPKRTLRTLNYIDQLMGDIIDDKYTIDDYKKMLEEEAGVVIKCD